MDTAACLVIELTPQQRRAAEALRASRLMPPGFELMRDGLKVRVMAHERMSTIDGVHRVLDHMHRQMEKRDKRAAQAELSALLSAVQAAERPAEPTELYLYAQLFAKLNQACGLAPA